MTASVASELSQYRSLAIALIAGITVSVGMFVAFLNIDLAETRRDLDAQARIAGLLTENLLSTAFSIVATEADIVSWAGADRLDGNPETLRRSIEDLELAAHFSQFCIVDAARSDPAFRLRADKPCPPQAAGADAVSKTLLLARHENATIMRTPAVPPARWPDLVLTVPVDAGRTAVFTLAAGELLTRSSDAFGEEFRHVLRTCLYWFASDVALPIGCNDDNNNTQAEAALPAGDQGAIGYTAEFTLYGQRWQVASRLRPSAMATTISVVPIAVLLFFLVATAAVSWYVYASTDQNLRLNRQQRKLQRALGELHKRNEDLEQFAYMASHDLQTPIRHIISRATMIQDDLGDKAYDEVRRNIDVVAGAGERMHRFVVDLLEFCRAGEAPVEMQPVVLDEVVRGELAQLASVNDMSHVTTDIRMLPTVDSDETKLAAIVHNLLSNAIRFGKEGEPLRIEVGATRDDSRGRWVLFVRDTGIGIDENQLERIFLPFKRLEIARDNGGTGVGLSIAKKLAERIGGEIWAESAPGAGTTFHVAIPDHYTPVNTDEGAPADGAEG